MPGLSAALTVRRLLIALPLAKLVLHLATLGGYGIFRDELYYIACAGHPDWGYVDHPPLSVWFLVLTRALLGDSLFAMRLVPALLGALTVWLVGKTARQLGGGAFAVGLAMLGVIALPYYLSIGHFYSMNAFELAFWAAAAWLVAKILRDGPAHLWLILGAVLGLGLLNKISVLWLGAGIFLGFLATSARRHLAKSQPWLGGLLAVALFLPYVLWQVAHDWPTLEFIRRATEVKMAATGPLDLLLSQLLITLPTLPIWTAGLVFLLKADRGRWRPLGVAYLVIFAILAINGASRAGYLGPAYTWLLAAGGVGLERLFARPAGRWLQPATAMVVIVLGAVALPLALPALSADRYVAYAAALGQAPRTEERKELARLPQFFADMHGWEEMVDAVEHAAKGLSLEERATAVVFANNYGVAGAVDHLGGRRGLPPAVSGHNNYWLWGRELLEERRPSTILVVGGAAEDHRRSCAEVVPAATVDCGDCMPYEDGQTVYICRGIQRSFEEIWTGVRHFD